MGNVWENSGQHMGNVWENSGKILQRYFAPLFITS